MQVAAIRLLVLLLSILHDTRSSVMKDYVFMGPRFHLVPYAEAFMRVGEFFVSLDCYH